MSARPPGLFRPTVDADVVAMVCTAGHVDHGKTSLVKLLTGCATDRLREEQERGMTIELGFAPCFLGGEVCIGIVDVPGHERLIKNMVAGVSGIDMALMVVAADDGVMPQTIEHLAILALLGVRRGIIALTKIDLVAPARIDAARAEIERAFADGFLAGAPIYPVSSVSGEGLDAFYAGLVAAVQARTRERRPGVFRMPVERSFAREGFGTVVTGIPVTGAVRIGDALELQPGGRAGRVRGIQCFLRPAEGGGAGQCLALNIPELARPAPERGQVLCVPGHLAAHTIFHLALEATPDLEPPLRHGEPVKFYAGTSEANGKLYLLEERALPARGRALASIVLAAPVAAAGGDRFLLRRPSPAATVAGGEILCVTAGAERPRTRELVPVLRRRAECAAAARPGPETCIDRCIELHLELAAPHGLPAEELARALLLTPAEIRAGVARLASQGRVVELAGRHVIAAAAWERATAALRQRLDELRAASGRLDLPEAELRGDMGWPSSLFDAAADRLEEEGQLRRRRGAILFGRPGEGLAPADRALLERVLELYRSTGFGSPRPDEVPGLLGAAPVDVDRILRYLLAEELLYRLSPNVVLSAEALREAERKVVQIIEQAGVLDSAEFKHHIGSSRKYALAILDWLDARGVTVRRDNLRTLAVNHRQRLLES